MSDTLPRLLVDEAVRLALLEDLGRAGDITTDAVVPADAVMTARFVTRRPGTVAGLPFLESAFRLLDPRVSVRFTVADGASVAPGDVLAEVAGPARAILTGERVALNYLGRLSGIATATRRLVTLVAHTPARVTCTRKTTPGLRAFEKWAVRMGGGSSHRYGLDDAILIKDNHIAVAGGVRPALERARAAVGHLVKLEVEIDRLQQLPDALAGRADVILLDNMDPATLRQAVTLIAGRAVAEASGGITEATIAAVAESGVEVISVGWLTHSAPNLDIGLDVL